MTEFHLHFKVTCTFHYTIIHETQIAQRRCMEILALHFIKIGSNVYEVRAKILCLRQVTYGIQCTNFHETQTCRTTSSGDQVYPILYKPIKKYGSFV
jgi:hypothetical protein